MYCIIFNQKIKANKKTSQIKKFPFHIRNIWMGKQIDAPLKLSTPVKSIFHIAIYIDREEQWMICQPYSIHFENDFPFSSFLIVNYEIKEIICMCVLVLIYLQTIKSSWNNVILLYRFNVRIFNEIEHKHSHSYSIEIFICRRWRA